MAPYESSQGTQAPEDRPAGRRKAVRYAVPVAVAGVAAATIGLVPALASSGDPDLPDVTAQQLIEKIAASDVQQLSGSVKITTDLGLPSLADAASSFAPKGDNGDGSPATPDAKLLELATGSHTLRVAADGPDKQKLSIVDDASEYSIIHNGKDVWAYDSASDEAFHAEDDGSRHSDKHRDHGKHGKRDGHEKLPESIPSTPKEFAEEALKAADETTSVTVDGTARVADRDAYQLLIKPKGADRSTIGAIRIAVDAENGTPLKFTLTPSSGGKAVVDAGFTSVDFGKPAASTFDFKPAKGTKVTEAEELEKEAQKGTNGGHSWKGANGEDFFKGGPFGDHGKDGKGFEGLNVIGEGWSSIATFDTGGQGIPSGESGDSRGSGEVPPEAGQFLDALGDKVSGKFGSGTVFSTRLVNALVTEDGKVYVGAVTKEALVDAANSAK